MSFGWVGRVIQTELGRFGRSIVQAFKLFYEYLFLSVLISAFWYGFAFLPVTFLFHWAVAILMRSQDNPALYAGFLVAVLITFLAIILWAAPVTASAYAAVYSLITREGFYIRDLFLGIKRYFKKAAGTAAIALVVMVILIANIWFYANRTNSFLQWLTILFWYLLAFGFMALQYLFPFIVQQEVGVLKTLQRAVLVAMDNVIVSLLLLAMGVLLTYFSWRPVVPLMVLYMGLTAGMHNYALIEILKKYDDPPPGFVPEEEK